MMDGALVSEGPMGRRSKISPCSQGKRYALSSKIILVVDDDGEVRSMIKDVIEGEGHCVLQAADGNEALTVFHQNEVDLIVLDILMPEKDGLEVIRELRGRKDEVKILAISGGGREEGQTYIQIARGLGACDSLVKPFGHEVLMEKIEKLLA